MNPVNQFYLNQLYENHWQYFNISSISENITSISENTRACFLHIEKSNFHVCKLHHLRLLRVKDRFLIKSAFLLVKYVFNSTFSVIESGKLNSLLGVS